MTAQALTSNSASTGLAVGAVVTGLLAGAVGGFFFGITGGIMGGLIFGLLGGIAGMSMASFCSCCAEKKRLKRLSATVRALCHSQQDEGSPSIKFACTVVPRTFCAQSFTKHERESHATLTIPQSLESGRSDGLAFPHAVTWVMYDLNLCRRVVASIPQPVPEC